MKGFFRQDSAITREHIATLDEQSLRHLRDQLHSKLVDELPAIAGRPLTKRMPGNVAKLADDCWAFGASLAQEALLKEADSVLKAPDRRLPITVPRPSSATQTAAPAADTANLEAVLSNMIRMDRELQQLRASDTRMKAIIAAQQIRLANLEERAAKCTARDESPSIDRTTPSTSALPAPTVTAECPVPAVSSASGETPQAAVSPGSFSAAADPVMCSDNCLPTGGTEGAGAVHSGRSNTDSREREPRPQDL